MSTIGPQIYLHSSKLHINVIKLTHTGLTSQIIATNKYIWDYDGSVCDVSLIEWYFMCFHSVLRNIAMFYKF